MLSTWVMLTLFGCQEYGLGASLDDAPEVADTEGLGDPTSPPATSDDTDPAAPAPDALPDPGGTDTPADTDPADLPPTPDEADTSAEPAESDVPLDTDVPPDTEVPIDPGEDTDVPGTSDDTDPPAPPPDCDLDPHQILQATVTFPARRDCAWSQGTNLGRKNEHNQAIATDEEVVQLPPGATLCTLALRSTTDDLEFDDHMTLALDDIVLVGGGSGYAKSQLPVVGGLSRFDWSLLRGQPFVGRYDPYFCLGGSVSPCEVPPTEQHGALAMEPLGPDLDLLVDAVRDRQDLPFRLHVLGDDNDGDCRHTDTVLEVTVGYVE